MNTFVDATGQAIRYRDAEKKAEPQIVVVPWRSVLSLAFHGDVVEIRWITGYGHTTVHRLPAGAQDRIERCFLNATSGLTS